MLRRLIVGASLLSTASASLSSNFGRPMRCDMDAFSHLAELEATVRRTRRKARERSFFCRANVAFSSCGVSSSSFLLVSVISVISSANWSYCSRMLDRLLIMTQRDLGTVRVVILLSSSSSRTLRPARSRSSFTRFCSSRTICISSYRVTISPTIALSSRLSLNSLSSRLMHSRDSASVYQSSTSPTIPEKAIFWGVRSKSLICPRNPIA
mmetsp:Transcript_3353/g.9090  ORF Transcript_3353/g.9090 Transcript_3353/m.9090 type:complete len:210 (+) Transcript_3353:405-1034(+)